MEKPPDIISSPTMGGKAENDIEKVTSRDLRTTKDAGQLPELKSTEAKGVDKAYAYASVDAILIDDKTNRRLLRKIDRHVLPWLLGLYVLQFLDKGM